MRRQKSYSAQSGYVYQYFYEGQRPFCGGAEFVFDVTGDRKICPSVSVLVADAALEPWERSHGRALTSTERYAIAKMALFQAFDERPNPASMQAPIQVRAADVEGIMEMLGMD